MVSKPFNIYWLASHVANPSQEKQYVRAPALLMAARFFARIGKASRTVSRFWRKKLGKEQNILLISDKIKYYDNKLKNVIKEDKI